MSLDPPEPRPPTRPANLPADTVSDGKAGKPPGPAGDMADVRDAQLVAATLSGRQAAFDALIETHQRPAVAVAYRLLGNLHDALEVAQEAFLRAYRSLDTLQDRERFGTWLLRIVTNLALNFRRARRHAPRLSLDDCLLDPHGESRGYDPAGPASTPGDEASAGELEQVLNRAIAELPSRQRLALVLFAIEGLPQKQVAEIMECSVEAVKWHVFTARKQLKERLGDYL